MIGKINLISNGILIIVVLLLFLNDSDDQKVGYIQSKKLFENYDEAKEIAQSLQLKNKRWQYQMDSLILGFKNELAKYDAQKENLSMDMRMKRESELRNLESRTKMAKENIEEKINSENQRVLQSLLVETSSIVREYGKKNDYDIILGANGDGNLIYGSEAKDLTQDVIEYINEF